MRKTYNKILLIGVLILGINGYSFIQDAQAQCPSSKEAISWGAGAISLFYSNEYLSQDRQNIGVSTDDLSLDNIIPITDDEKCSQLKNHILNSNDFPSERKNQGKVFFKNQTTQRYFVIFYTEPAAPGWTTFVYVLDKNFNKLGAYGV